MIRKASLKLSQVVQHHRPGLWILLLLLTATILLFPTQLRYEYQAIQSVYVFGDNLPLFGALYSIWVGILLLLLFTNNKNSEWQRLALVCTFALVFFGFWSVITPDGGHWDEVWNMGHIKYLEETGNIALGHPNLRYFEFPAFHLLVLTLSQVGGLGIFATRVLFLVFSGVLLAALLYLLFAKSLKSSYLASLAAILIMQGSLIAKFQVFWPGNLAFLLLVALLVLLVRHDDRALGVGMHRVLVMIILLAAFAIAYAPTPAYFIFIIAGIYLLQKVARKEVVRLTTIALFVAMFLAWEIYWATRIFVSLAQLFPTFIAGFTNPVERFFPVSREATLYIGKSIPLWAGLTRYFWLALIFGFGGILGTWNLVKARKLGSIELMETGGLLGVIVFTIVFYLAFPIAQWVRLMVFAPIFTAPIILRFLSGVRGRNELSGENTSFAGAESLTSSRLHKSIASFGGWFREHVFTLLIILCFVLSLPTFLIHETSFTTLAIYPYERSAGEFLESVYGAGEELTIFSSSSASAYTYYVPEARFVTVSAPELMAKGMPSEEDFWLEISLLLDNFEYSRGGTAIFVLSERFRLPVGHPAAIKLTDPRWIEFINKLESHNKTYDNGHTQIYEQQAK